MERILTGWSFQRVFYLVAGTGIMIVSFMDQQWIGMVLGGYFAAMGLLGFGCAAGACSPPRKP